MGTDADPTPRAAHQGHRRAAAPPARHPVAALRAGGALTEPRYAASSTAAGACSARRHGLNATATFRAPLPPPAVRGAVPLQRRCAALLRHAADRQGAAHATGGRRSRWRQARGAVQLAQAALGHVRAARAPRRRPALTLTEFAAGTCTATSSALGTRQAGRQGKYASSTRSTPSGSRPAHQAPPTTPPPTRQRLVAAAAAAAAIRHRLGKVLGGWTAHVEEVAKVWALSS